MRRPLRADPGRIELVLQGPITPHDRDALCERVRSLLGVTPAAVVICDVGSLTDADLATLDAVATVQLNASRLGARVWLRGASAELRELLRLAGLEEILPSWPDSGVEARRKAEGREEAGGVEEEGDPADPAA